MSISLSKPARLRVAAAFKVASKYLAKSDTERYGNLAKYANICACLEHGYRFNEISKRMVEVTKTIISERLENEVYYEDWVAKKLGFQVVVDDRLKNDGRMKQDGRRRWLKSLIKEFSK
jgi:hypothetical protein